MEKLYVLGTGYAMATECYNTCFALENENGILLVDAGGGSGILSQIKKANISYKKIQHLIVTHEHSDHLLGVVWIIRKIATMMEKNSYEGNFNIWCHNELPDKIKMLVEITLQKKFAKLLGDRIILNSVDNSDEVNLLGWKTTFFDILSTKAKQFGFTMDLINGKKLTCLGDEPYNEKCLDFVKNTDILLAEAFCLYSQRDKFKPYEKHHSTVNEASQLAQELEVKTLVLWHTEDENYTERKELYSQEGKEYYSGNLLVPYDMEILNLDD